MSNDFWKFLGYCRVIVQKVMYVLRESCQRTYTDTVLLVTPDNRFMTAVCSRSRIPEFSVSSEMRLVVLRDDWTSTAVDTGDVVNVIGNFVPFSYHDVFKSIKPPLPEEWNNVDWNLVIYSCVVASSEAASSNLMIAHPDVLLTGTRISTSFGCLRKTILEQKVRIISGIYGLPLIQGEIAHDLFQYSLLCPFSSEPHIATESELTDQAKTMVRKNVQRLYQCHLIEEDIMPGLMDLIPKIVKWARSHVVQEDNMKVVSLYAIEEKFWSLMYGLKGQIDVSLKASFGENEAIVPLELKTGKAKEKTSHIAQVMLYSLAMTERYNVSIPDAILCYIKGSQTRKIAVRPVDVRNILLKRNEVASFCTSRTTKKFSNDIETLPDVWDTGSCLRLPGLLKGDKRECQWCDYAKHCRVLHDSTEGDSTLSDKRKKYVQQWMNLIEQEESEAANSVTGLWTQSVAERSSSGVCIGSLSVDCQRVRGKFYSGYGDTLPMNICPWIADDESIIYLLVSDGLAAAFRENQFTVGEFVVISLDCCELNSFPMFGVAQGTVISITSEGIAVSLDQALRVPPRSGNKELDYRGIKWRMDKMDSISSFSLARGNVLSLYDGLNINEGKEQPKSSLLGGEKLLKLIVDLDAPKIEKSKPEIPSIVKKEYEDLNNNQQSAIDSAIVESDYSLILGMPGTGKTTVIALLIRSLVAMNKRVLLVSHTHTAVDNVLLKLVEGNQGPLIARMGRKESVHPLVARFCMDEFAHSTVSSLSSFIDSKRIFGCTCLGIGNAIIGGLSEPFDVCIVDEASQISEPHIIGPLLRAHRFVLVGDHYQLPPLVRNREAKIGGAAISLFRRLSEKHPQAVIELRYQYRMNSDVLVLPNTLIYDGKLMCGSDKIAENRLKITNWDQPKTQSWLPRILDPSHSVCFLNTDRLPAPESKVSRRSICNTSEVDLTAEIATALTACGVHESDIGVISPYRAQVKLISQRLSGFYPLLEICTVDKFQGRDKSVIIMSFVRSNPDNDIGSLLNDWRRLNVAFSRAKCKIILIGSRSTLERSNSDHLKELISVVDKRKWMIDTNYGHSTVHVISAINISPQTPTKKQVVFIASPTAAEKEKRRKKPLVQATIDDFGLVAWNPIPKKPKPKPKPPGGPRKRASQQVIAALNAPVIVPAKENGHNQKKTKKRKKEHLSQVMKFGAKLKRYSGSISSLTTPMNTLRK